MITKHSLDGIINTDIDEILDVIRDISTKNIDNHENLKNIVINSNFPYKYELMNVPDELFVGNIIMCLLYSSIDPFLANTPIMKRYQDKVVKVCNELGFNPSNVVPVSSIEEKLHAALL